ncbi:MULTISPECIES: hypothetical protein [unclassified Peribacillus]
MYVPGGMLGVPIVLGEMTAINILSVAQLWGLKSLIIQELQL